MSNTSSCSATVSLLAFRTFKMLIRFGFLLIVLAGFHYLLGDRIAAQEANPHWQTQVSPVEALKDIIEPEAKTAIAAPSHASRSQACYPGSGWTWTYGPYRPDVAAKAQQALRESGIETLVEAREFGETDSCGSFELYALDFTIEVRSTASSGATEQEQVADRIRPILAQLAAPQLGNVRLKFASTGDTLVADEPVDADVQPTTPSLSASGVSLQRKVYVLVFDPLLSNGQTLSQHMGWYDYAALVQGAVDFFQQASGGWVQYTVVHTAVLTDSVEAWPLKEDGYRYTEAEYLAVLSGQIPSDPGYADYNHIVSMPELDIRGKLNGGEIDELWTFGAPYFGFYESRLVGPGAYWYNSLPVPEPSGCNRLMPIMGLSYERELACLLESFGHRMESTMARAYGSWQENRTAHNWDRFALDKAQSPDYSYSGCGNTHYPPNGTSDYDYGNPSTVLSNCDDFANYPNLGDPAVTAVPVTCSAWGCSHLGFFNYWYSHLPRYNGCGPDDKANSWWTYFASPALALDPLAACDLSPGVRIEGPATGPVCYVQQLTATVSPISVTLPITFVWEATEQSPVSHVSGNLTDTVAFTWAHIGAKVITVTAVYAGGTLTDTHQVVMTEEITATFSVSQGSDDAGLYPDGCSYSISWNEIYFGKCTNGQDMTGGFRFVNVTIPRGSRILHAYTEFTVDGRYSNELVVAFHGEATRNAPTFSSTDSPAIRPLTSASTTWSILASDVWNMGEMRNSPELSGIVQEIVNRLDWKSGNALAIITQNAGSTTPANSHRRVYAYEREPARAARLVISYIEPALTAGFYATPMTGVVPLAVTFTGASTGNITQSQWDFGDGATSALPDPTHTYTSAGVYTVTLTVSGPRGTDTLTRTDLVTAYAPVHSGFTAWPTSGIVPLTVTFTNTSSGDYTACLWSFGDGVTSTLPNPTHTYTAVGVYNVTLTVSGPGGSDTESQPMFIVVEANKVFLPIILRRG